MNKSERAALAALLDNVELGFTKCLPECKILREFLKRTTAPSCTCGRCHNCGSVLAQRGLW
jgi:hypothetical protein